MISKCDEMLNVNEMRGIVFLQFSVSLKLFQIKYFNIFKIREMED